MYLRQFARALWASADRRAVSVEQVARKYPRFAGSDVNLRPMIEAVDVWINGVEKVRYRCNGCGSNHPSAWSAWKHASHTDCVSAIHRMQFSTALASRLVEAEEAL